MANAYAPQRGSSRGGRRHQKRRHANGRKGRQTPNGRASSAPGATDRVIDMLREYSQENPESRKKRPALRETCIELISRFSAEEGKIVLDRVQNLTIFHLEIARMLVGRVRDGSWLLRFGKQLSGNANPFILCALLAALRDDGAALHEILNRLVQLRGGLHQDLCVEIYNAVVEDLRGRMRDESRTRYMQFAIQHIRDGAWFREELEEMEARLKARAITPPEKEPFIHDGILPQLVQSLRERVKHPDVH